MTEPTLSGASRDEPASDSWPSELDALFAAPAHHTLLFENERVRALDTIIAPGDRTPIHTHRWPAALYILSWSAFVRYGPDGDVLLDSRAIPELAVAPAVLWSAPLPPHALENVGERDLHVISIEIKGAQG